MVLGILLCLLMGALDQFVVLTALGNILIDIGAAPSGATFIISAYLIASTVAIPLFARLSDIYDRKTIFLAGLLTFIAGSILAGLSQNLTQLIIFRAVQGFGSGAFFPVGLAIVAIIFPPETRARVTGLLSGVFGVAIVAGPFIGSAIVDHTTWRWIFYVNIPIGVVGLILLLVALGPILPERKIHFDAVGAALLAGWVAALMLPLVETSQKYWSWDSPQVIGLLSAATVLVILFSYWELRHPDPLVPLPLLGRRIVAACGGTTALVGGVLFPLATFVTLYVQYVTYPVHGGFGSISDATRDALYFLVLPVVVGAALGGNLLTRVAYRTIVTTGTVLSFVGALLLMTVDVATPFWKFDLGFIPVGGLVFPLMPIGFGIGLTFPVFFLAVQNQVPEAEVGAASGLVQFLQSLGGSISLLLLTSFQSIRLTALAPVPPVGGCPQLPLAPGVMPSLPCLMYYQAYTQAISSSFDSVFSVLVVLLALAIILSLFITGRLPRGSRPSGGIGPA